VQALAQAYASYYGAVADANRAQFRLYRALGEPAQLVADQLAPACAGQGLPAQILPPVPLPGAERGSKPGTATPPPGGEGDGGRGSTAAPLSVSGRGTGGGVWSGSPEPPTETAFQETHR